jgi:hypothetical protein
LAPVCSKALFIAGEDEDDPVDFKSILYSSTVLTLINNSKALLVLSFLLIGCAKDPADAKPQQTASPVEPPRTEEPDKRPISIKNIQILGRSGFAKREKAQLLAGDVSVPYPTEVEMRCELENTGYQNQTVLTTVTADWIIAPATKDKEIYRGQFEDDVAWTNETKLGEVLKSLRPGLSEVIPVSDFNLRSNIEKYGDGETDTLWPWRLRIHVRIIDGHGETIDSAEKVLSILPKK